MSSVDLTLHSTFYYLCATSVFTHCLLFIVYHYMFWTNWPSSGVQALVMKKSVAHCNAVLLFLHNCLGLILGYVS
jgi:hypothetical protein